MVPYRVMTMKCDFVELPGLATINYVFYAVREQTLADKIMDTAR